MFQIIAAMAEFERSLIVERVKAGLENARRRGKRLGRPRVVVSFSRAEELASQGLSRREIGRRLGVSEFTIRRLLGPCEKIPAAAGARSTDATELAAVASGRE